MPKPKAYWVSPQRLDARNLSPRYYDPAFLFVKERLQYCPALGDFLACPPIGGGTPPQHLFRRRGEGVPYLKTSTISRDFLALNDLFYIHPRYHGTSLKRSIARPYDVVYTMTGKFMGKAALIPPQVDEANISQNSVLLRTSSELESAYLALYLNSRVNRIQVAGTYTISKQKYLSQGKIASLRIVPYESSLDTALRKYLDGVDLYYQAYRDLQAAADLVDEHFDMRDYGIPTRETYRISGTTPNHVILTPQYYSEACSRALDAVRDRAGAWDTLDAFAKPRPGDEIGSANYAPEGIPFIRTSDLIGYDIDYQPNWYCSEGVYHSLEQKPHLADILLTKDGRIGELAVVGEDSRFVFGSGVVQLQSGNLDTQALLFAVLASQVGRIQLRMWSVISSTMPHLRPDFFSTCMIPRLPDSVRSELSLRFRAAIDKRKSSYRLIGEAKAAVEEHIVNYNA